MLEVKWKGLIIQYFVNFNKQIICNYISNFDYRLRLIFVSIVYNTRFTCIIKKWPFEGSIFSIQSERFLRIAAFIDKNGHFIFRQM